MKENRSIIYNLKIISINIRDKIKSTAGCFNNNERGKRLKRQFTKTLKEVMKKSAYESGGPPDRRLSRFQ